MATIGKIREKQGLIVAFVGIAMLLFVIDPRSIWNKITGSGGEQPIGKIYGEPILDSKWNFEGRVEQALYNERSRKQQNGQDPTLNDYEIDYVRSRTWQEMIIDTLINTELSKLGITVSENELNDPNSGLIYGANPSKYLQQMFTYGQGEYAKFERDSLLKAMNNLLSQNNPQANQYIYENIEVPVVTSRKREKYLAMIKLGMIGTLEEAKLENNLNNTSAAIRYVYQDYLNIPDSVVNVTDEDINAYFEEHRYDKKWNQESEKRSISYVSFNVSPSQKDKEDVIMRLNNLKPAFENAPNDSLFVLNNSQTKPGQPGMFDPLPQQPYEGGAFPVEIDEEIASAPQGAVVGPFANGNSVAMVKIRKVGNRDEAQVRHILILSQNLSPEEDAKKKALADSLMRVIKLDTSKFSDLAVEFSEDPGSKSTGGFYNWFPKGRMVPEFENFSFDKPVGSVGVVKTTYGYHIVEVLGQQNREFKMIAAVDAAVIPSQATQQEVYDAQALSFYNKVKETGNFNKVAEEMGLPITESNDMALNNSPRVQGIQGNSTNVLKFAFNNETGAISEPEYISDVQIIVATVTSAAHEGDLDFETAKVIMRDEVIKDKKATYIEGLTKDAATIEDAASIVNAMAQKAEITLAMENLPANAGEKENAVIGQIFALEQGKLSSAIRGNNGVYIVVVEARTSAAEADELEISRLKGELTGYYRTEVENRIVTALMRAADVKDWRLKRTLMN